MGLLNVVLSIDGKGWIGYRREPLYSQRVQRDIAWLMTPTANDINMQTYSCIPTLLVLAKIALIFLLTGLESDINYIFIA